MMKKIVFALLVVLTMAMSVVYAQETLTISTYYPSPYGSYNELQLSPHVTSTACNATTEGTIYYDSSSGVNTIKVCRNNGSAYQFEALGGAGGYWTANGNNIYNSNTGNVGIGTSAPSSKLTVNGGLTASGNIVAANNTWNNCETHTLSFIACSTNGKFVTSAVSSLGGSGYDVTCCGI
jgi:hypothetical protein